MVKELLAAFEDGAASKRECDKGGAKTYMTSTIRSVDIYLKIIMTLGDHVLLMGIYQLDQIQ